jgi:hypothetical protein
MSEDYLGDERGTNPILRKLADAIIYNQGFEIAVLARARESVTREPVVLDLGLASPSAGWASTAWSTGGASSRAATNRAPARSAAARADHRVRRGVRQGDDDPPPGGGGSTTRTRWPTTARCARSTSASSASSSRGSGSCGTSSAATRVMPRRWTHHAAGHGRGRDAQRRPRWDNARPPWRGARRTCCSAPS